MAIHLQDEVMTLEDVSSFLKVGEQTVYNLTREGNIPARKIGREWRYLKSEVLEFMKSRRETQDGVVQLDGFGGEYKVQDGQTMVALWLPMSLEQKQQQINKAEEENTSVSALVSDFLQGWLEEN